MFKQQQLATFNEDSKLNSWKLALDLQYSNSLVVNEYDDFPECQRDPHILQETEQSTLETKRIRKKGGSNVHLQ